jgi:hypothetical protein
MTVTCETADGAGIVAPAHIGRRDTLHDAHPLTRVP